jgi:hypothetical protein
VILCFRCGFRPRCGGDQESYIYSGFVFLLADGMQSIVAIGGVLDGNVSPHSQEKAYHVDVELLSIDDSH